MEYDGPTILACHQGVERSRNARLALRDAGSQDVWVFPGGTWRIANMTPQELLDTVQKVASTSCPQEATVIIIYDGLDKEAKTLPRAEVVLKQTGIYYRVVTTDQIKVELYARGVNPTYYFNY